MSAAASSDPVLELAEAQAKLEAVEGLLLKARCLIRDEDVWSAVDFITEHVALVEEGGKGWVR